MNDIKPALRLSGTEAYNHDEAKGFLMIGERTAEEIKIRLSDGREFDAKVVGSDPATDVALVFTALSHAGSDELVGKKRMFVNCTHESLVGGHLELIDPDKVALEIPPLAHTSAEEVAMRTPTLAALRKRGFHLAFNHTVLEAAYAAWLPLADYIKLDLSVLAPDQLAVLISHAQRHSRATLVAEKVETAQQYDMVSSYGVQ